MIGGGFCVGDRVWLMPDSEKREPPTKLPAVVERILTTGRVKVKYVEHRCKLFKTITPMRLQPRDRICEELGEKFAPS